MEVKSEMDVANVVKEVFFVMAMAILAVILYELFFVYPDGSLWVMTERIQAPISAYYYRYCYIPNLHQSDGIDTALGMDVVYTLENTPYNLESVDTADYAGTGSYYTTGWR